MRIPQFLHRVIHRSNKPGEGPLSAYQLALQHEHTIQRLALRVSQLEERQDSTQGQLERLRGQVHGVRGGTPSHKTTAPSGPSVTDLEQRLADQLLRR